MLLRERIGEILVRHGSILEEQVDSARAHAEREGMVLGEALVALGFCSETDVVRALAEQDDFPFVDLQHTPPQAQALRMVSHEVAQEYAVAPVRVDGGRLVVACANPSDIRIDDVVRREAGMPVTIAMAVPSQVRDVLARYEDLRWGRGARVTPAPVPAPSARAPIPRRPAAAAARSADPALLAATQDVQTVHVVNSLVASAMRKGAAEVRFEPEGEILGVRSRIDGHLYPLMKVPAERCPGVVARLKVMSGLPLQPSDEPLEGPAAFRVDGRELAVTITTTPQEGGDLIVVRRAQTLFRGEDLTALGMGQEPAGTLRRALAARRGLVLVAGPPESGRTTTLYTLARSWCATARVAALELRPEGDLPGAVRLGFEERSGARLRDRFPLALKEKPDVLLISDLQDRTGMECALRAAESGILVLATSAAGDGPGALARLLDNGAAPAEAATALTAIVAQRLVRRVCAECAKPQPAAFDILQVLRARFGQDGAQGEFVRGRGCAACHQLGTRGRTGVFEVLAFDEDLRTLISERAMPSVIRQHLERGGYRSLEWDALERARRGEIPLDELRHLRLEVAADLEAFAARGSGAEEAEPDYSAYEAPAEPACEFESWDEVAGLADSLT